MPDTGSGRDADPNSLTFTDSNIHSHKYTRPYEYSNPCADPNTYGHIHPNIHGYQDCHTDANIYPHANTNPHADHHALR